MKKMLISIIKSKFIRYIIKYISGLSVQCIYWLSTIFLGIMGSMLIISGTFYFVTDTAVSLMIFVSVIFLSIPYLLFYTYVTRAAVLYIFYTKTDVNKWLAYFRYSFDRKRSAARTSTFQLATVIVSYYNGEFQNSIDAAEKINIAQLRKPTGTKDEVDSEFLLNVTLVKVSAMLKNEVMFEKHYLRLYNQKIKTDVQSATRANLLTFCQSIKEIYIKNNPTDVIDEWQPEFLSNLLSLEKIYFQALNEQLKENNLKARELFKELSQENPDLFFVKEAKKYLEENK